MEIQLWKEILEPYTIAVDEMILKFNHMKDSYHTFGLYSPIEQVTGRVKSISSLLEKAQKKKVPVENLEGVIEDIAGIRIICQLVDDIYKVADLIRKRNDMQVISEKDYIKQQKESGYRSYHMIVSYQAETLKGTKCIHAEIQLRTLAMNFWATIEHSLQYKYKEKMPASLNARLREAAKAIVKLDAEMSSVRDEIMDAQNTFYAKENIVADILSNIQNLYTIANKREVIKIQDEFIRIYETADMEALERFHRELDIVSEGYRAQSIGYT